jgi:hypothetical protein
VSSRSSCERKLRHLDYFSALQHATNIPDNETVVIYPCRYCLGLHCGHSITAPKDVLQKRLTSTERKIGRATRKLECSAVQNAQETQSELQRLKDLSVHLEYLKAELRLLNAN